MAHSCCGTQPLRLDQTCCKGVARENEKRELGEEGNKNESIT